MCRCLSTCVLACSLTRSLTCVAVQCSYMCVVPLFSQLRTYVPRSIDRWAMSSVAGRIAQTDRQTDVFTTSIPFTHMHRIRDMNGPIASYHGVLCCPCLSVMPVWVRTYDWVTFLTRPFILSSDCVWLHTSYLPGYIHTHMHLLALRYFSLSAMVVFLNRQRGGH